MVQLYVTPNVEASGPSMPLSESKRLGADEQNRYGWTVRCGEWLNMRTNEAGIMKKQVWKFELKPESGTPVVKTFMPPGSVILTAAAQGDSICVWAEVDLAKTDDADEVFFEVFGTGHDMHCDMGTDRRYIGTAFLSGGKLVFHVYHLPSTI